ncbi:McrB family protein [Enterococcus sp. HY326]|uniref:McrB family protein n=1 Tax=Enterococcus sp. HY326 TaxID=2971265 RepID=UPI00223F2103|nr:AAA family ATPase [Enterococcus sp. HY326]
MEQAGLRDFSNWYEMNQTELLSEARKWKTKNDGLREEWLADWPLERIATMSLDEYVLGKGSQNKSFCYELEQGKYSRMYLGIKGGAASKFGIYYSKSKKAYCDQSNNAIPEEQVGEKFEQLKKDLFELVSKGIQANFDDPVFTSQNTFLGRTALVIKLLCIYSENSIFMGVNNRKEQNIWGDFVSLNKNKNVYKQNYEITQTISSKFPELNGDLLSNIIWEYHKMIVDCEIEEEEVSEDVSVVKEISGTYSYQNKYSKILLEAKNIILRGAPGTGKTYLANEIAADIVSYGRTQNISKLTEKETEQIGFVQFHPSYDYTDFVEGLRPISTDEGAVSFKLEPGSFKSFVEKAKDEEDLQIHEDNFEEAWDKFFEAVAEASGTDEGYNKLTTLTGKPIKNLLVYERNEMQGVYPENTTIYLNHDQIYKVYKGQKGTPKAGFDFYRKAIVKHLKEEYGLKDYSVSNNTNFSKKNYVFIIDEINRGEISKIFGELFFSIDPGYRGSKHGVLTQYANLHDDPQEKFFIPDNVYIIGTMNDIDRSVDTFDFAMRRRFTFLEVTAKESAENMLEDTQVKFLMSELNNAIISKEMGGLTIDYQIGASYFLLIDKEGVTVSRLLSLWDRKLKPLLKDYFRGEFQGEEKLANLEKVYFSVGQENEG